jgi:hypothetical protein
MDSDYPFGIFKLFLCDQIMSSIKTIYIKLSNRLMGWWSSGAKLISQPENWENRNGPDLVQAFPKKWLVDSDFTAP